MPEEALVSLGPREVSCFKAVCCVGLFMYLIYMELFIFLLVCPCAAPLSLTHLKIKFICIRANCLPCLELGSQKDFSFPIILAPGLLLPARQDPS